MKRRPRTHYRDKPIKTAAEKRAYKKAWEAKLRTDAVRSKAVRVRKSAQEKARRQIPEVREQLLQRRRKVRQLTVKESVVESYLVACVEARGGFCPKFVDPGRRGAPDRLVIIPGYPTHFVELKRPRLGQLESHQKRYHERLIQCGQPVSVLSSKEAVDGFFLLL